MALIPHLPISIDTSVSSLLSFTMISSIALYGSAKCCNLNKNGLVGPKYLLDQDSLLPELPLPLHQPLPPRPRVLEDFSGMTVLFPRILCINKI